MDTYSKRDRDSAVEKADGDKLKKKLKTSEQGHADRDVDGDDDEGII